MSSLWGELNRRNVVRVALAYIIVAWLLLQVSDTLVPALHLPEWFNSGVALLLILGFPIAILFAWAFEMTPEGLKKEAEVDRSESITRVTGRKLDFVIIAVLACAVLFFVYDKFGTSPEGPAEQSETVAGAPTKASIAVLPFVNMSGDASNEYFSDGLSEELLNLLAKVPEMHVAARTSSFSFKDQPDVAIAEIARELNVANVLEGSVRKSGTQIRITAQLIDAETGYHLWSKTYDRELENIFITQDEIAAQVTDALKVTLLGEAPSSRETNPEAYELFLQAQYISHQDNQDAYQRAIGLYEQALAIDPDYAPAWAELATTPGFWYAAYGGMLRLIAASSREIDAAMLQQALQYRSKRMRRHIYARGHQDRWRSTFTLHRAAFGTSNVLTNSSRAAPDMIRLPWLRAMAFVASPRKALELPPKCGASSIRCGLAYHNFIGTSLWSRGRYDEALEAFDQLLTLAPDYPGTYRRISGVHIAQGDYEEALAVMDNEIDEGYRLTGQASAHVMLGNTAGSRRRH